MIVIVRFRVLVVVFVLGGLVVLYLTHVPASGPRAAPLSHLHTGSGSVELRSGPGPDHTPIAVLPAGTSIDAQCWALGSPTPSVWFKGTLWIDNKGGSETGWVPGPALDLGAPTLADPSAHGLLPC